MINKPIFDKFCRGDFSLYHVFRPSRSVVVDSDQIETLLENDQYNTTQEITVVEGDQKAPFSIATTPK